jgi:gliding motility-associated-like protein
MYQFKRLISGIILVVLSFVLYAQESNNWYFGQFAGITFNTTPPTALTSPMISDEATAVMSDRNGNILFYTNSELVYDRTNNVMPNGSGIMGDVSNTTVLALKIPASAGKYLIITSGSPNNSAYRYTEIDMNLRNGLGDVTANKNIAFAPGLPTERIAAVKHANKKDYWLITKEFGNNRFNTFKLSCNGISSTPVVSNVGLVHNVDQFGLNAQGQIKISPDSKKVAVVISGLHTVELFDFDNSTGTLSNPITIAMPYPDIVSLYGVEFSPNSKVLYLTNRYLTEIYQFDLSSNIQAMIISSKISIPSPYRNFGLQLGPDNKLYLSEFLWPHVGVINNPDNYGTGFNYVPAAISLGSGTFCRLTLPTCIAGASNNQSWTGDFTSSFVNCYVRFDGNTSMPGPNTWVWDFGDGVLGNGQSVQHSYKISGNYNVTLKIYSQTECGSYLDSIIVTHSVSINNVFNVDFDHLGACTNENIQFNDSTRLTVGNITGYNWDFGDGNGSTQQNPVHSYAVPGVYNVKLVVSTSGVCRADSITKAVYIDSKPIVDFRFNNGCVNQTIVFTDQSTNSVGTLIGWTWDLGGLSTSNTQNSIYSFNTGGIYNIRLSVNTEHGCIAEATKLLTIDDKPVAKFITSNICLNQPINFSDLSSVSFGTINFWQWDFGNGNTSVLQNPTHTYSNSGIYNTSLVVKTVNGCISAPFIVAANVQPVNANAGRDTIAVINQPFQLSASGGSTYLWSPAGFLNNPNIANPIALLSDDQLFTVTVTTSQGCVSSDEVKITVIKNLDILVPSGFTPNNDGKNDILRPYPLAIKKLIDFRVYNRSGEVVFSTNVIGKGWDGKLNGIEQNGQVVVWTLKVIDLKNQVVEKKGISVLIR